MIRKIKKLCFVLMVLAFFLPMARGCSHFELFPQTDGTPLLQWDDDNPPVYRARDLFLGDDASAAHYAVFAWILLWPLPFLLTKQPRRPLVAWIQRVAELAIGAIALYICALLVYLMAGRPMVGGYLYFTAAGVYLAVALYDLGRLLMRLLMRRRAR